MIRQLLLSSFILISVLTHSVAPALGEDDVSSTSTLEWEFLEAETALVQGELHIAESHYRAVLKEGWFLLGLIEAAEGDLPAAREALSRARNAAAVDLTPTRFTLALVELHLGEIEQPLKELRLVVQENGSDAHLLKIFLRSLQAVGREEESRAELETLRGLDPAAAAEMTAMSATGADSASGVAGLPSPSLGSLGSASPESRDRLRSRLRASLVRVYRNLAAVKKQTGFVDGLEHLEAVADEIDSRQAQKPFGKIDLTGAEEPRRVQPFRVSPVALMAKSPPSLRSAIILLDDDQPERAMAELRGLLGGDDSAAARSLLASILAEQGQLEAAETTFLKAIETDPEHLPAHQGLARLYWLTDRRTQAIEPLRRAAELGRLDRDLTWALAEIEQADRRLPEARRQLASLDKRFDSAEALMRMSDLSLRAGEEKRAFDEAERALQRAPNSEETLLDHARLALDAGIINSAATSVEPLVRMYPDVAEYRFLLGQTWSQRRRMGEASEAFLKAVELDPEYLPAHLPLGLALNHESRFEEAGGFLRRYLDAHPENLDALAGLAESEERLGDSTAAETQARAVLAKDPDHARANLVLGMVFSGRDEFAQAREFLQKAVDVDPWLAKAHYQLSFACTRLADRTCAAEHLNLYKKALEGPESTFIQLDAQSSTDLTTGTVLMKKSPKKATKDNVMKKEGSPP